MHLPLTVLFSAPDRYRLKNKLSNMEVQLYDSTWQQPPQGNYNDGGYEAADTELHAPTLKQLTLKQFLNTHARLKAHASAAAASCSIVAQVPAWGADDGRVAYSPGGGNGLGVGTRQRPRSAQPAVYTSGGKGGRPGSARGPGSGGCDVTQQPRRCYNPPPYITQQFGAHPDGFDAGGCDPHHSSTTYMGIPVAGGGAQGHARPKQQGAPAMSAWEEAATPARLRSIGSNHSAGAGGVGGGYDGYREEGEGEVELDEQAERVQQQLADAAERCQAIVAEIGMLRDI